MIKIVCLVLAIPVFAVSVHGKVPGEELGYIADNQGEVYVLTNGDSFSAIRIGTFFPGEALTRQYVSVIGMDKAKEELLGFGLSLVSRLDIKTGSSEQRLCQWIESVSSTPVFSPDGTQLLAHLAYVEVMVPPMTKIPDNEPPTQYGLAVLDVDSLVPIRFWKSVGPNSAFMPDGSAVVAQGRGHKSMKYDLATGEVSEYLTFEDGYFYGIKWVGTGAIVFKGKPNGLSGTVTECLLIRPNEIPKLLGDYPGRRLSRVSNNEDDFEAFYDEESSTLTIAEPLSNNGFQTKRFVVGLFKNIPPKQREALSIPIQGSASIRFDGSNRPLDAPWSDGYLLAGGKVLFCDNPGTRNAAHLQLLDIQSGEWSNLITFGTGGATNFVATVDKQ